MKPEEMTNVFYLVYMMNWRKNKMSNTLWLIITIVGILVIAAIGIVDCVHKNKIIENNKVNTRQSRIKKNPSYNNE